MLDRTTKLRLRRRLRRSRRQVEDIGAEAEQKLDQHFIGRFGSLVHAGRFLIAWIILLVLLMGGVVVQTRGLSKYYQVLKPIPGGTYTEGILGNFTNANPLYAVGTVDSAASRLVFASLLSYDKNNQLVGDLAEKWIVNQEENEYTVVLKKDLKWHDGHDLTSEDVVFTYEVIKSADAKSPLASSWQGVNIEAKDNRTILFKLPNSLSAFPHSLTNGIAPKHLLEGIPLSQLRSVSFNTLNPIGSGPFRWDTIEVSGATPEDREQRIGLTPYDGYHKEKPKLNQFVIRSFTDEKRMLESFKDRELDGVVGLESLPDELGKDTAIKEHNLPLTGGVMVFFKNSHEVLSDINVRRALVLSSNTQEIISSLGYPVVALQGPLLKDHVGFNPSIVQAKQNIEEANRILEQAGWKQGPNGIRTKNNRPLAFRLFSEATDEYTKVSTELQKQWKTVGADVETSLQPDSDIQTAIAFHNYDALLYGISLGTDPDVFPYWHSSQADIRSRNRLNLSEYKSVPADKALESGRTRSDPALRAVKYKPFLEAWRNDAPALALYQPRFLYVTHGEVFGLEDRTINTATDRFANVENWMIRQAKTKK